METRRDNEDNDNSAFNNFGMVYVGALLGMFIYWHIDYVIPTYKNPKFHAIPEVHRIDSVYKARNDSLRNAYHIIFR
jgi:hypothetical protein